MTARCRVPSRVGARVPCRVSTRVPGRVDAQLVPSSHPSRPPQTLQIPSSVHCRALGVAAVGKGGEEEGKRLRRGRNGGFSWCLLPPAAHHSLPPEGICRVLSILSVSPSRGSRTCAARLPCNLCCSPRWEKPELTREQPAEVRHLPSKPRADKTLPHC